MQLQESGEMYLETILILGKRRDSVRAVNVAEEMRISKASVSRALSRLKDEGCLIVDGAGNIAFTENVRQIAEKIYERHLVLTEVIMSLGVDRETATADACRIEHVISDVTFQAMKDHIKQYGKQE